MIRFRRPAFDLKRGILTLLLVLLAAPAEAQDAASSPWVVSADEARRLIDEEDATVLDTRSVLAFRMGHLPSAVRADWTRFSRTNDPHKGKLLPRKALQAALRAIGVDAKRPVVVIGNPPGDWGEDGRIVWMLRAAGHPRAALVNGGFDALKEAGAATTMKVHKPSPGDFEVGSTMRFSADREDVRDAMKDDDTLLLDTREPREYSGATPHGESRGGHVPGAKPLHFRDLMTKDGHLLSRTAIQKRLRGLGATKKTTIIAYCTGGVRSGWMVAVLRWAGFEDVRNYAGSMWEWASAPADEHPLTR